MISTTKQQKTDRNFNVKAGDALLAQKRYRFLASLFIFLSNALCRASTMLLEVSMRMGAKQSTATDSVKDIATRRATRQQQRILLQISVFNCDYILYFYKIFRSLLSSFILIWRYTM